MKPVVLHVSEAFGGGVITAVAQFARLTGDQYRNLLIARTRHGHETGDRIHNLFTEAVLCSGSLTSFARAIHRTTREWLPDIIHLHSTWAGILGRIVATPRSRIIYSPHCFGFERTDVSSAKRQGVRVLEAALAPFQAGYAAIGDHEACLARSLAPSCPVWTIPNSVAFEAMPNRCRRERSPSPMLRIAMVGRAAPQKGVDFFIDVARSLDRTRFKCTWIGGGCSAGEAQLRGAGIEVTGWLPREKVLEHLMSDVDIYLHTAAWEGTPITLLEAATLGIPIVCRRIPHLAGVPVGKWVDTPKAAAAVLREMTERKAFETLLGANTRILDAFSAERTRRALLDAYEACRSKGGATGRMADRMASSSAGIAGAP